MSKRKSPLSTPSIVKVQSRIVRPTTCSDVVGRPALAALTMAVEAAAAPVAAAAATARRAAGPRRRVATTLLHPRRLIGRRQDASGASEALCANRDDEARARDSGGRKKRRCRLVPRYYRVPPGAIPDGPRTAYRFTPAWPYRYRLPGPWAEWPGSSHSLLKKVRRRAHFIVRVILAPVHIK